MKQKDLHTKQQDELKKQEVSSDRSQRRNDEVKTSSRTGSDRRDVASEDRIREKLRGRP